jgi:hypothetical protein
MGSIPLPALDIRPPQQQVDPVTRYLQIRQAMQQGQLGQQQIQAAQQENQLRQMQLDDMRTIQQIAPKYVQKDESGKVTGYDFDALTDGAITAGVRPQSLAQLQTMRKNAADTLLAQAQGQAKVLENINTLNDQARGHLEAFRSAPPEQKQAVLDEAFNWMGQNRMQAPHIPRDASQVTDAMLDSAEANLAMGSQLTKEAQERSDTAKNTTQALLNQNKLDVINGWKRSPQQVLSQVDSIVSPSGPNAALNMRTKSQVQFALANGDVDGAKAAIKQAAEQVGAIEKETNPAVIGARVQQAVATEVGKERALAAPLQQLVTTTRAGKTYINRDDIPQGSAGVTEQQAAAAGIPVVDKDTASTLKDIDTAKANQDYMLNSIGKKLATDPTGRLFSAPANTIEKLAQTDPQLAAMGTFRNAAIQSMRAVAGSKGLRINQYEVQLAIDNDIPKMTDTLPVAQQKLQNLQAFLGNAETAHLVRNRQQTVQQQQPSGGPPAGATHIVPGRDERNHYTNAAGTVDLGIAP